MDDRNYTNYISTQNESLFWKNILRRKGEKRSFKNIHGDTIYLKIW